MMPLGLSNLVKKEFEDQDNAFIMRFQETRQEIKKIWDIYDKALSSNSSNKPSQKPSLLPIDSEDGLPQFWVCPYSVYPIDFATEIDSSLDATETQLNELEAELQMHNTPFSSKADGAFLSLCQKTKKEVLRAKAALVAKVYSKNRNEALAKVEVTLALIENLKNQFSQEKVLRRILDQCCKEVFV